MLFVATTVTTFQGNERRIVVFDPVLANPRADVGFMSDTNRLNIAVSQPRDKLILVGSREMYKRSHFRGGKEHQFLSELVRLCGEENAIIPFSKLQGIHANRVAKGLQGLTLEER